MIRPYRAADADDVADVCVRTAAAGGDATGKYSTDDLMPDVFARPYLEFAPDLAFVVEHTGRARGYILGVADTRAFVTWFRENHLPGFAHKYAEASASPRDQTIVELGLMPERMLVPEVDDYPAHLHVDLLPELQGQGLGRELIDRLRAELTDRGIRGLHLSMDPANVAARAFYDRLGFIELPSSNADSPLLGIRLR